jgi:sugar/nucleoside kinase (ribokinase family)
MAALYEEARCKILLLKLGERGIALLEGNDFISLDSFVRNLEDPVGAGDALLAYSTLAHLVYGSRAATAVLGAVAAAIECERDGNIPVTRQDMRERLTLLEKEASYEI